MNCAVHTQTPATAYCRTCGKALCEDCKRDVMGAIYCEPCIAARLQGQSVGASVPPPPRVPGAPNPGLAGFLGLMPGVGAMYNGQFMKAFAHVVIFILLIFASDHISGLFGIGIGFWVCYMAFEAYKTAEAKRLGIPAPDPLGLDKMLGLHDQHTATIHSVPPVTAPYTVPPSYSTSTPVQIEPPPPPAHDSTPVGAIVLIVLGGVFLLANFGLFDVDRLWPLMFIGIGLWIAFKRTTQQRCPCVRCRARGLMGSAVLITLGVLFLLQSYHVVPFDNSFPVLLLVIGCVLLVSRTGSTEGHIERGWVANPPPAPPPTQQQWTSGVATPPPPSPNDTQVKP
ncbi:MAG TPA: B-box zinc finger protein [Candidatus Angelobacter sp.]|nr:B-box zinc finger protein [Candidatus Angelobacter sp.]